MALKRSETAPVTLAEISSPRAGNPGLRPIWSFSNLHQDLMHDLQLSAAERLQNENVIPHSSAMKRPNRPIVLYEIEDESEFNAAVVAKLIVKNKIHGVPVWNKSMHKFVGTVELVHLAKILLDDSITSQAPDLKLWGKYLSQPQVTRQLLEDIRGPVFSVQEKDNLFHVVEHLAAEQVHRVVVVNETGYPIAVVSEKDVLEFFQNHPSCFTFKDGSEIPIMAHEMADPSRSGVIVRAAPDDSFQGALRKLINCNAFSIPIVGPDGKLMNSFTLTDLKHFFCTPKERSWDMNIRIFLAKFCGKLNVVERLRACTLGVPLTRMIQLLHVDHAHVIWVTDMFGRCIGELSISDICSYITEEVVPKARKRDLPDVPEEAEQDDVTSSEIADVATPQMHPASSAEMPPSPRLPRKRSIGAPEDFLLDMKSDTSPEVADSPDFDFAAQEQRRASQLFANMKKRQSQHELAFPTFKRQHTWVKDRGVKNQCILITYPDCFGGNLKGLKFVVDNYFKGVLGGIHILPFYPSSADRGFAPLTYKEVEPRFGDWKEVCELSEEFDVCCDFMVNHISQKSEFFQEFKELRNQSKYKDLFIRYQNFFQRSGGEPTAEDLAKIYTRKPRAPFFEIVFDDGEEPPSEKLWCTFDFQQIDIDCFSETGREFIRDQLVFLCEKGVKVIRLDAFGYATKKLDTRCFMEEPDVWDLLKWLYSIVEPYHVQLLAEIHEHYTIQLKLSRFFDGKFWVYDFALPMLLLHALYDSAVHNLHHWLSICPHNQYTTLDTHDGIGVVDVKDLMTDEETARTSENLYKYGANVKRIYSSADYDNLDIYQINCTYYSALGNQDDWYMLARAVQLFTPGIPQIYYVGLMAGVNDIALLERTKVGRDINRHFYDFDEVDRCVQRPVVKQLFALCRFRNTYPAFNGEFTTSEFNENEPHLLTMTWKLGDLETDLACDFLTKQFSVHYIDERMKKRLPLRLPPLRT